jgi:hypothetical protein
MGGERVETPILTEMRPCKMWNLRNRHIGRREENNPLDHINVPHQPVVVQDDPQHVAAVRGMLHVPLPQPQQTAPLVKTAQAHVVQQHVPVQSSTGEISSLVHITSSNQDEPLFIPGLTNEYDMIISQNRKDKYWNFEYIDLSLLHKQTFVHNTQENQNTLQFIDGKLVVQS